MTDLASAQSCRQTGDLTSAVLRSLAILNVLRIHSDDFVSFSKKFQPPAGQRFVPGPACFSGRQHPSRSLQPAGTDISQQTSQFRHFSASLSASRLQSLPALSSSAVTDGASAGGVEDKWIARVLTAFQTAEDSPQLPYP